MSKPVIAAVEGPAVAGGMELAMWCDVRVMAESAYFGVYCRRWGVPLIDGGTVRLPRLVGQGKALEIIMTGRKVTAEESYRIGLAEKVVPHGKAREAAEAMAQEIARFPQECMRSDRLSVYRAHGKTVRQGLESEWATSAGIVKAEGIRGATRFAEGKGRHGDFGDI
jgi:enoyl-CoA hydratase